VSDIIEARELIDTAIRLLQRATKMMLREPAIKKAPARYVRITDAIRAQVRALAAEGKSNHDIAEQVGLRNGGRVSEILNGKR
jgi:DNA-binding NarL/FixJ family response regulator